MIADYIGRSALSNVKMAIEAAKKHQQYNSLISLTEERALERAAMVDSGQVSGRLAGVPFVVKDNFLAFGSPTTAGSRMLADFQSPLQATAVERLEAEGAICIGKANLDAFAHGGSTENSAFGLTKNAKDASRVAGGSSGGSAVSVALDVVPFALGTDTGGSIRQPASFNGVYGFKPSYGAVSRFGVVAMASSTDTIGCFARSAAVVDLVMQLMAGIDAQDMTTIDSPWQSGSHPEKKKIGLIRQFIGQGVDPEVRQTVLNYAERLSGAGYHVEEVDLEMSEYSLAVYYILTSAEIASNMARYDGVRFGYRAPEAKSIDEVYKLSRSQGLELENKRRIIMGNFVLSSGYFDAYYLKAQKARTLLIDEFRQLFEQYDYLLGPVSPSPAFEIGQNSDDPVKMYLADIMTVPASLAGLPALSIPFGTNAAGLPIGVQLIGDYRQDGQLLEVATRMGGI